MKKPRQKIRLRTTALTNRNYIKGASYERKVKRYFEEHNYSISRSAGSHGIFDLQGHDDSATWDIQCKAGMSKKEALALVDKLADDMLEKYPLLRIPVVVAVMFGWQNKMPVGVHRILLPNVEKVEDESSESVKQDVSRSAERV
jgi:hypothetical protein